MKYHTKTESAKKYKEKATLKQSFYDSMKDWKTTSIILASWIVGDILGLISMVLCLNLVQNTLIYVGNQWQFVHVSFNIGWTLMCARLAGPANRLNILPGQAMGYPAALMELLNVYGGWNITPHGISQKTDIQKNVISNSLIVGQIILGWIPAIVGIGGFVILTKQQIKSSNEGQLFTKK